MKNILVALIGSWAIVGGSMAFSADAVPDNAGKAQFGGRAAVDCSKAADPEKCQAQRKERRERFQAARKACEGKNGDDRRGLHARTV